MAGSVETLRQNIAALNVTSPVGAEIAREQQGNYRGETVTTSSDASKLQDAAEELGMAVAHRADKRSLDRREVRQGQGANLAALARIADYYDKLPDMPREDELRNLVEMLQSYQDILERGGRGGGQSISKDNVLALLQQFDPDVTHQFASLDIAREFFGNSGASETFQRLLDEAHLEYSKGDLGREVRAGLASSKIASQSAVTLETDPAAVRDAYRALLREARNFDQLFEAFRTFDIMKDFNGVIETFMAIAGSDLASTGPSTDPSYLHALLTELGRLKKMQSVIDLSSQLISTTDRLLRPGEKTSSDATDVAGRILAFASNAAASPVDARQMLARYEACSPATLVAFANGLRGLHAEVPDDVMPSPQARVQQSTALLGMLDTLVAEEEREYENAQLG